MAPFGGDCEFSDFDDCVRHNKNKKNPRAYCSEVMRRTEDHCKNRAVSGWHRVSPDGFCFDCQRQLVPTEA